MPYLANYHTIGCLPESSDTFDNIEDAWQYLIDILGDDAWEPDDEDNVSGPHSLTQLALKMQAFMDNEKDGCVYEPDGIGVYEVEWIVCACTDLACPDH